MTNRMFRASAEDCGVTAESPKAAAQAFFAQFPRKRKCSIREGTVDGRFFTVIAGRTPEGRQALSFKDVTKKGIETLPCTTSSTVDDVT